MRRRTLVAASLGLVALLLGLFFSLRQPPRPNDKTHRPFCQADIPYFFGFSVIDCRTEAETVSSRVALPPKNAVLLLAVFL